MTIYEDLFWMSVLLMGEINLEKTTTLPLIVDKTPRSRIKLTTLVRVIGNECIE